jgi:hypothetical protein
MRVFVRACMYVHGLGVIHRFVCARVGARMHVCAWIRRHPQ